VTRAKRCEEAIEALGRKTREAVEEDPGVVVFYDPIAVAKWCERTLAGTKTTKVERARNKARADKMVEALRRGASVSVAYPTREEDAEPDEPDALDRLEAWLDDPDHNSGDAAVRGWIQAQRARVGEP
jgi:uncharacterized protein YgfB (UPF0149 family)